MRNFTRAVTLLCIATAVCSCKETRQDHRQAISKPAFNPHPTADYLTPEESLETICLPDGYRAEIVASEPMIREPVAIVWDGNARMYVAEMLTYMQDADATGEQEPVSRISLLEDTDNDGKMDKSTVFIDSLLLPRMMQTVGSELLVNETNTITIHSYQDTNGDGKADVKKVVYQNDSYLVNDANMEHQRSGMDWNLDNWMYITYDPVRFRYTRGRMEADTLASGSGGQWGVTHDNYGRLFYSRAGGEIPALGFQINPAYGSLDFADQYDAAFSEVWPLMATPDVQGGPLRLRADNTLNHFTAPCGQSVFRGDRLPADMVGDYIVCEPVARAIRRADLVHEKGKTYLKNVYHQEEFIASTDMNFRPVNTATGPDGQLYVVDMHRGIIQQGNWTKPGSFLRHKIDSMGLAENTGHGRIYRIVHEDYQAGPVPRMLDVPADTLLTYLDHPNGWWRDQAQKELISRGHKSVVPALQEIAAGGQAFLSRKPGHLGRIHALWTLEGLDAADQETLMKALKDKHPQVRKTAVWIAEPFLQAGNTQMIAAVAKLADDEDDDVRVQLLLSLYGSKAEQAQTITARLLQRYADHEMLAAAKKALENNADVKAYGSKLGRLSKEDRQLVLEGASIFKSLCAGCHGMDGKGLAIGGSGMAAPPLAGSPRLAFLEKNTTIRILLHGLSGPVDGQAYAGIMPAMQANSDAWIASVASYIRYEFGGRAPRRAGDIPGMAPKAADSSAGFTVRTVPSPVVTPEEVKKIREESAGKETPWTLEALEVVRQNDSALHY